MPTFKEIPGYPGYGASDDGIIWTRWGQGAAAPTKPWAPLTQHLKGTTGHLGVCLKGKARMVHRLILETFVGPRPQGMECRHLDGNPANNHLTNLCWGTRDENFADRVRLGESSKGEDHHSAKLTAEKVVAMRREYAAGGITYQQLADKYGVIRQTAEKAVTRVTWKHVA